MSASYEDSFDILIVLLVGVSSISLVQQLQGHQWPAPGEALAQSPLHLTGRMRSQPIQRRNWTNIAVYKRALPSVVNVTSSALSFDFFYGVVPSRGRVRALS